MNNYNLADNRYTAIKKREYEYKLKIFIFCNLFHDNLKCLIHDSFINYKPSNHEIKVFNQFLQLKSKKYKLCSKKFNNKLIELGFNKDYKLGKRKLKELCPKYFNTLDDFKNGFREFYGINDSERCCGYCGISEKQISDLHRNKKINTIRLKNRGTTMEIDRVNPHEFYDKGNIILSCYWCNNAKTDEFDKDEFKEIARGNNNVWSTRLGVPITFPTKIWKKHI